MSSMSGKITGSDKGISEGSRIFYFLLDFIILQEAREDVSVN